MCDEFIKALAIVIDHVLVAAGGWIVDGATISLDTKGVTRVRVPVVVSRDGSPCVHAFVEVMI